MFDQCVVGAGIIGLTIALKLTEAGQSVLVLDGKGMGEETSRGNAGAFAFADVEPLASTATLLKSPRWLLDPLGPLSVPPLHALKMAPWMAQFARACLPHAHGASTKAQAALMTLAKQETEPMFAEAGLSHHLRHDGALYLYEGAHAFDAAAPSWELKGRHGVTYEPVTGARLAELQPGLGATYTHAMHVPEWLMVSDPYDVTVALGQYAVKRGAAFRRGQVSVLKPDNSGVSVVLKDGNNVTARQAIIAAGAWSKTFTDLLGDKVPLEAERGYNTTLPSGSFDLRRQLVLPADGYVITPLASGIRIGGAAEFAGLHRPPDYRRSTFMLNKAKRVMTGLKIEGGKQWMGARPSLPDTLPVIGRSPSHARVLYAFGHGHLGLTQCAATARIICDLALDREPPIDCHPYRAERFH